MEDHRELAGLDSSKRPDDADLRPKGRSPPRLRSRETIRASARPYPYCPGCHSRDASSLQQADHPSAPVGASERTRDSRASSDAGLHVYVTPGLSAGLQWVQHGRRDPGVPETTPTGDTTKNLAATPNAAARFADLGNKLRESFATDTRHRITVDDLACRAVNGQNDIVEVSDQDRLSKFAQLGPYPIQLVVSSGNKMLAFRGCVGICDQEPNKSVHQSYATRSLSSWVSLLRNLGLKCSVEVQVRWLDADDFKKPSMQVPPASTQDAKHITTGAVTADDLFALERPTRKQELSCELRETVLTKRAFGCDLTNTGVRQRPRSKFVASSNGKRLFIRSFSRSVPASKLVARWWRIYPTFRSCSDPPFVSPRHRLKYFQMKRQITPLYLCKEEACRSKLDTYDREDLVRHHAHEHLAVEVVCQVCEEKIGTWAAALKHATLAHQDEMTDDERRDPRTRLRLIYAEHDDPVEERMHDLIDEERRLIRTAKGIVRSEEGLGRLVQAENLVLKIPKVISDSSSSETSKADPEYDPSEARRFDDSLASEVQYHPTPLTDLAGNDQHDGLRLCLSSSTAFSEPPSVSPDRVSSHSPAPSSSSTTTRKVSRGKDIETLRKTREDPEPMPTESSDDSTDDKERPWRGAKSSQDGEEGVEEEKPTASEKERRDRRQREFQLAMHVSAYQLVLDTWLARQMQLPRPKIMEGETSFQSARAAYAAYVMIRGRWEEMRRLNAAAGIDLRAENPKYKALLQAADRWRPYIHYNDPWEGVLEQLKTLRSDIRDRKIALPDRSKDNQKRTQKAIADQWATRDWERPELRWIYSGDGATETVWREIETRLYRQRGMLLHSRTFSAELTAPQLAEFIRLSKTPKGHRVTVRGVIERVPPAGVLYRLDLPDAAFAAWKTLAQCSPLRQRAAKDAFMYVLREVDTRPVIVCGVARAFWAINATYLGNEFYHLVTKPLLAKYEFTVAPDVRETSDEYAKLLQAQWFSGERDPNSAIHRRKEDWDAGRYSYVAESKTNKMTLYELMDRAMNKSSMPAPAPEQTTERHKRPSPTEQKPAAPSATAQDMRGQEISPPASVEEISPSDRRPSRNRTPTRLPVRSPHRRYRSPYRAAVRRAIYSPRRSGRHSPARRGAASGLLRPPRHDDSRHNESRKSSVDTRPWSEAPEPIDSVGPTMAGEHMKPGASSSQRTTSETQTPAPMDDVPWQRENMKTTEYPPSENDERMVRRLLSNRASNTELSALERWSWQMMAHETTSNLRRHTSFNEWARIALEIGEKRLMEGATDPSRVGPRGGYRSR